MKIKSNFAILDVKKGRKKLLKHIGNGNTPVVVMMGTILGPDSLSNDDGISREFGVDVTSVVLSDFGDNEFGLRVGYEEIKPGRRRVHISYEEDC